MNNLALDLNPKKLTFVREGRWYKISECRRYTISKCIVDGKEKYDAWRKRGAEHSNIPIHLGCCATPEEAERLCRAHAA